ncbi:hypothetical protein GCM10009759_10140 [Kitasatospora saccharophila]|uniref:Uncharacterized protein n=1 Tax=Kitasatospora saccharophila TaxID=407973 RepID=A0ABP5HVW6_9ACTN
MVVPTGLDLRGVAEALVLRGSRRESAAPDRGCRPAVEAPAVLFGVDAAAPVRALDRSGSSGADGTDRTVSSARGPT